MLLREKVRAQEELLDFLFEAARAKSRSSSPSPPMLNITFAMRPV
jgi:hypothetical protein